MDWIGWDGMGWIIDLNLLLLVNWYDEHGYISMSSSVNSVVLQRQEGRYMKR